MGSNHTVDGSWQTGPRAQGKFAQGYEEASDNELENRMQSLDKLLNSLSTAPGQRSFSREPQPLDIVNDLRAKIKASRDLFRVAKLLSDPARESMFSKIRDSLNDLEESIAYHLGVKTT